MKELTIEEKAKRYDEAIEKFDVILNLNTVKKSGTIFADDVRKILPELEEIEDERTRQELIAMVKLSCTNGDDVDKKIAWLEKQGEPFTKKDVDDAYLKGVCDAKSELEKQGEQKPAETVKWSPQEESCICQLESLVKEKWRHVEILHNSEKIKKMSELMFFLKTLNPNKKPQRIISAEAKEEMYDKPADKLKPKFKVGDWITNSIETVQITGYDIDYGYQVDYKGNLQHRDTDIIEKEYHLWTIKDTKDGDVLATENFIFIFKNIDNGNGVHYYCQYEISKHEDDNQFDIALPQSLMGRVGNSISHYSPATKEQRDTLMKAMADAGYTFDFEKKELKKIEQKPVPKFEVGDVMRTLQEAVNGMTDGMPVIVSVDDEYYHCTNELIAIKDQDDYEYPPMNRRQKPAWSEEDEKIINRIEGWLDTLCDYLKDSSPECIEDVKDIVEQLKSTKERVQCSQTKWKPSEEQMQALAEALSLAKNCGEEIAFDLRTLHEQLKKLK